MRSIKIMSWNVNGLKKNWDTLLGLLRTHEPELVFVQNYRAYNTTFPYTIDPGLPVDIEIPDGQLWVDYFSRISLKGNTANGVALFMRWRFYKEYFDEPYINRQNVDLVFQNHAALYASGRISAYANEYVVVLAVLPPAGSQDPTSSRAIARRKFDDDLLHFIVDLRKETAVIVTGDFKVAAEDIDVHPHANVHVQKPPPTVPGYPPVILHAPYVPTRVQPALRQQFNAYKLAGLRDALRLFTSRSDAYTCWAKRKPAEQELSNRELNIGWRTDYFLVDRNIKDGVTDCVILDKVTGSRNAPILLTINLPDPVPPEETPPPPTEDPPPPEQPDLGADNTYDAGSSYNPYDMFNFVP
jgi:exodeoxyribonuclease III